MHKVVRNVKDRLNEALGDTRIVVLQGARQVGKTTLAQETVDDRGGVLVTLDDELRREEADADPAGFLAQAGGRLLAIDEIQRAPKLVLALKLAVDRDPTPGRFLITGSANLLRLPTVEDSLAGRAEDISLHGFSQGELAGRVERFIDMLLAGGRFADHEGSLTRHDYLERAIAGGYPEALSRASGRRRDDWFDGYVSRIVQRDAEDVSALRRLGELPLVLRVLAARNAGELNVARVSRDTHIPARTLEPYIELLETLYLIQRLPAWSRNLTKRAVSRTKVALLDTGLAARLMNVSAAGATGDLAGPLLEGFVAAEVRKQLAWSEERARLWHYRDRDGVEVDLVVETPDGRVAGIEVKSAAAPGRKDAKGLSLLREKLGERFVAGVILHTGQTSASFGDRISAVPIDVLWRT